MFGQKPKDSESSDEHSWIVTVSDKGLTVNLSKEAMESGGKTIRTYLMRVVPWFIGSLIAFGGTAGIRALLLQQQDTPAISPTEEVTPQQ